VAGAGIEGSMSPCPHVEPRSGVDLERLNRCLEQSGPQQVVAWAAETFGAGLVLSTSFGIQSAAMLHLATRVVPDIPVVWVDTGYLPPETYRFADELTRRLHLNLHVAQAELSPARMEALHGRLWEDDAAGLDAYHRMRKVEPMQRALRELRATAWLAGLRADQTRHRGGLPMLGRQGERFKILPILRWSRRDVHRYLKAHDLPHHPLFEQGYASVGDWHSSRPVRAGDVHERDTRFRGLKQECGLHLDADQAASLESSQL
jgi:phosphoadenosine phosphosulfate reductase